ncbi:MAG: hypothetical protein PHQ00_00120 [Phycisphaerae bacterium]|nr:hypothetical protein [Phycisphaerae bacterium]
MNFWQDIIPLIWLSAIAVVAGLVGHFVVFRLLMKIAARTKTKFDESFLKHCFSPSMWAIILLVYRWFLPLTAPENYVEAVARFISIAFTVVSHGCS